MKALEGHHCGEFVGVGVMKLCPICKSPLREYKGVCAHCGLNLNWVRWRAEGLMAIVLAVFLAIILPALWGTLSRFVPGIVPGILLIAGIASAIVYDLKISNYSRKTKPAMERPPPVVLGPRTKSCKRCGQQMPIDSRYCEWCGEKS